MIWNRDLRRLALISVATVFISGCALAPPDYGYKRPFQFGPRKERVQQYQSGAFRTNYDQWVSTGDKAKAKEERNHLLYELMYFVDAAHGQFTRNAVVHKAWLDVGSDFAILGLSGAGAVVGGAGTKAILAAIAGGVQGAQLTVSKKVFREQAIEAIQSQMRAAMMKRKAEIIERMRKSVDDYPLDLALTDIVEYYYDGTFTRAFQNMVSESKKQEESANQQVSQSIRQAATEDQIQDVSYITAQLKAIRTAANEQQALDRARRVLAGWGIDTSNITTRDQALERLAELQEELLKPESRARLPQLRKLFEATQ